MFIDMLRNVNENYDDVHHNVVNIQQQGEIINCTENVSDAHHNYQDQQQKLLNII